MRCDMKDKLSFISIILIVLLFGFGLGYAFKELQMKDIEKTIMQKHCYKYGGWGCEQRNY